MMILKMLVTARNTSRILVGSIVGLGVLLTVAPLPTLAQAQRIEPLEDLRTKDGSDFFNGRGNGQSSGIMNFIQNAIIGTPKSSDEFASEQQENFNDAAAQFRKQQAERLRRQQAAPTPSTPMTTPPSN